MSADALQVEVAYAERDAQLVLRLELPAGTTAGEALAVALPRLEAAFPHVAFTALALGVWGEAATPDTLLKPGDRVELYRALVADPKLARRSRADQNAKRRPPGSVHRR